MDGMYMVLLYTYKYMYLVVHLHVSDEIIVISYIPLWRNLYSYQRVIIRLNIFMSYASSLSYQGYQGYQGYQSRSVHM